MKEQTIKIRNTLDERMEVAVQKRSELISTIVQKAQKESEKLDKASQLRMDREKSKLTKHKIATALEKAQQKKEQLSNDTVQKAKTHSEKVQIAVQSAREKKAMSKKNLEIDIEQKIKNAQQRKDNILQKKVQTAQMFQAKRSPSKDHSPVKED